MPLERVPPGERSAPEWRRAGAEAAGLQRYFQTVRERWKMILATVVATTLAAAVFLVLADSTYKAHADLLITPVSSDDSATQGLPVIRESNDPLRDVQTAARLATTRDVAERARRGLGLEEDAGSLLDQVSAEPVAGSNVLAVEAQSSDPQRAAALANAFGEAAVRQRSADFRRELEPRIRSLRRRIASGEDQGVAGPDSLASQLAQLESLRVGGDPTMRLQTRADEPDSPASPKPKLTIAAAILSGLLLGVGGAFAMNTIDPRLRREAQLRERFSLPILARIPHERRARTQTTRGGLFGIGRPEKRRALSPLELSPMTLEAYRTMRAMLAATSPPGSRSVLVTGPSIGEGKSTTAMNLASSLALTGHRVILVEADFRRPTIGDAFGVTATVGIGKMLLGGIPLESALVAAKPFGDNLRLLLADRADTWLAELLSLPAATVLLKDAERLADFVVVDSPPLTEVIDALPLAQQVDDVLLVVRLGISNLTQLDRLGDLLAQNDITPKGFAVVGVGSAEERYYPSARPDHEPAGSPLPDSPQAPEPSRLSRAE